MANAKKLDSGSWRCRSTVTINGKKITKSFTVSPNEFPGSVKEASRKAKAKAELLAREWQMNHENAKISGKTVGEAMRSYIDKRSNILEDNTYRGYISEMKSLEFIHDVKVKDVDSELIQSIINDLTPRLAPKSIRNKMGFLKLALKFAGNKEAFEDVSLPKIPEKKKNTPDHKEVAFLLDNTKEIMKTIICIGAFGGLREGEISALKEKDIIRDMSIIHVHSDIVRSREGGYIYKDHAKTEASTRKIHVPKEVIDMIPVKDDPEDFVINVRPDKICRRFRKLKKKYELKYTFHDLRHYATSMRSDLGLSEKYIKNQLGWTERSRTYRDVYDDPLSSEVEKFRKITNDFITERFKDNFKKKL